MELKPEGRNFLISSPNGSGKSVIVDAIDFLLTGQVSRMTGPGTKGIKLKDHAPHIDFDMKDVNVRALVEFNGKGKHPPHALHSEGHQDSMDICLYLALLEKFTENYIDLIVLDDVMMSVDAPHSVKYVIYWQTFFKGR